MSNQQYAECSRSVSEGDLIGVDKRKLKHFDDNETNEDKQVFFTLPRWMSGRKKRNKIKYVKIDVPFSSSQDAKPVLQNGFPKNAHKEERPSTFIRKLFRSNSFFSSSSNSASKHLVTKNSPVLDARSSSAFNFHSFDCGEYFKDKCPAVCGISNHGNTCFMNAVVQCLSNTDTFAEYFVADHFRIDLARRNKRHSKRYGTKGEVTEQLGLLLKSLWSCQYYAQVSNKFKTTVAKFGAQYEGNDQHDAQEFLLWLLDKVHEDLNVASKEKYKKTKGTNGRTDEDIAAEMLANHLRCNSSFIHDLLQGQMKSSLCCLGCGRHSNTFDPYLCVSLPIPQTHNVPLYLHLVYLNEKIRMTKVGLFVDSQATVAELREKLNVHFGTSKDNLLLLEVIDGQFRRTFKNSDLVTSFKDSQGLYAIETPAKSKNVSMESEHILLVLINKIEKEEGECEILWRPFIVDLSREVNYEELKKEVFITIDHLFKGNLEKDLQAFFSIFVVDEKGISEEISSSVDMPLYMPVIDTALLKCHCNVPHVKIYINWKIEAKELLQSELEFCEEHPSVETLMNSKKQSTDVSLQQCFDLYFNEEKLGNEDAWMCSYCRHRLPCVKTLSLWTIPDVFIVHLKRFRQSSSQRMKITTFVEFPFHGLDMNPYVATRNQAAQQMHNNTLASLAFWSPWKRSRCRPYSRIDDNVYELYAVCNHHGSMQGGHYTAYCRNPINGHWYHFDDNKVQEVSSSEVLSSDAYILFYQRSSLMSHSCASSSSSGYSSASSVGPDHWAFQMSSFFRDFPVSSKSSDSLYDVGKTASLDRRTLSSHRNMERSLKTYSTLSHSASTKAAKKDLVEDNAAPKPQECLKPLTIEAPPPPPPPPATRHYWTVTSV
ncbi:hypothetical protein JTE90_011625 [Oedothorax gibbosus]|uniref:Ubiquitin carboxyl-terminal hydrolase n=1 Tax=Oedothorax gibbosus TaxID=931172 RepID=A0AAV6U3X6_9ARAC|nr:hypothetical protein JTE90_011625 [Oedothorax gibbosus]